MVELADANVLIDLLKAEAFHLVGDLVRHELAEVYLPRIVYIGLLSLSVVFSVGITLFRIDGCDNSETHRNVSAEGGGQTSRFRFLLS